MNNATLINQTSGKTEYGTPEWIVESAYYAMGGIDLDPAAAPWASARLKHLIQRSYTEDDNGLRLPWTCADGRPARVWLNWPWSRQNNPLWVNKLLQEVNDGNVAQACIITPASTSEQWAQPLLRNTVCFLSPRTNYYLPDGTEFKGFTKGSMVTYIGPHPLRFAYFFSGYGRVMIPTLDHTDYYMKEPLTTVFKY